MNKFDSNAIMVMTMDNKRVGYISKTFNERIARELKEGKRYKVTVANLYFVKDTGLVGCNIKLEVLE